jgi:hypothetical protein
MRKLKFHRLYHKLSLLTTLTFYSHSNLTRRTSGHCLDTFQQDALSPPTNKASLASLKNVLFASTLQLSSLTLFF